LYSLGECGVHADARHMVRRRKFWFEFDPASQCRPGGLLLDKKGGPFEHPFYYNF
jgi:hypothetical protein